MKTEGPAGSPVLCGERRGSGQARCRRTAGPQDASRLSPTVGVSRVSTLHPKVDPGSLPFSVPAEVAPAPLHRGGDREVLWLGLGTSSGKLWGCGLCQAGPAPGCARPTVSPTGRALWELGALLAAQRNRSRPAVCEGKGGHWSLPCPQHDLSGASFLLWMVGDHGGPAKPLYFPPLLEVQDK